MRATCTECKTVTFIQNKKYGLCGECVYKKNHSGKSRQEVYAERAKDKIKFHVMQILPSDTYKVLGYSIDDISAQNARNQELAEQQAKEDATREFSERKIPSVPPDKREKLNIGVDRKKKKKSVKKISSKQAEINKLYAATCKDMDYTTEPVCTGCLKYQGGDIKLSHSHIISREDCKRIGRSELIYARENLTYHCLDWSEHTGCHRRHESPVERQQLCDYEKNMAYIKSISEELYLKYTKNE